MKVGTDGVLLGAWCRIEEWQERLLDVGCGTGLIALMVAQRSETFVRPPHIDAVEIDSGSLSDAADNVAASPWSRRIELHEMPIQTFAPLHADQFDHVIANPPFFSSSLLPPADSRASARHTIGLDFDDLCRAASAALRPEGILSVIIPFAQLWRFDSAAMAACLQLVRRADLFAKQESSETLRVMLEYAKSSCESVADHHFEREQIVIESTEDGGYGQYYRQLTKDFYLKF